MTDRINNKTEQLESPARRRALARLGLAAGVAYATPTVLRLDRQAHAAATPCPPISWPGPRPSTCPKK
jgi:hypothetical protein